MALATTWLGSWFMRYIFSWRIMKVTTIEEFKICLHVIINVFRKWIIALQQCELSENISYNYSAVLLPIWQFVASFIIPFYTYIYKNVQPNESASFLLLPNKYRLLGFCSYKFSYNFHHLNLTLGYSDLYVFSIYDKMCSSKLIRMFTNDEKLVQHQISVRSNSSNLSIVEKLIKGFSELHYCCGAEWDINPGFSLCVFCTSWQFLWYIWI